jgi:hypothetical protein
MRESKLTTLARERSALEVDMLSKKSIKWLSDKMSELRGFPAIATAISRETSRQNKRFQMGKLYYFFYDAKGKEDLPYYDRFPLVLALEHYQDGFLGLNLHYLPIKYRVAFLSKLLAYASYDDNDDIKRLRVTYDILNASKRFREFKPCIKQYLFSHVKSKILTVQPNEWEVATFLPVQQFKGAPVNRVWQESIQEIRKK